MGKTTVDPTVVTFSLGSLREISTINQVLDEALQEHAVSRVTEEGRSSIREADIRAVLAMALADVAQALDVGITGGG